MTKLNNFSCWLPWIGIAGLIGLTPEPILAAEGAEIITTSAAKWKPSLALWDWAVIGAYVLGMLAIGGYYLRRTKTADDYLLGGRKMKPTMIGLSLFATLVSSVSYLSWPGEMIQHGPMMLAQIAAYPLIAFVVGWCLIPHFMKLKVTSAYEILEVRLGATVRLVGAFFFLTIRLLWMAVILYATTKEVLVPLLQLPPSVAPWISVLLGGITMAYSAMGGLRAVVVTDAVQTVIMLAGAIATLVLITFILGGIGVWWPREWYGGWDKPIFWFASDKRTFAGAFLAAALWWICTAGSDQMAIQRYLSTRNVKSARRALIISLAADGFTTTLMLLVGMALLAYFQIHPQLMPSGYSLGSNADQCFPLFIANGLPPGLSGLVIAALLAAAMSSLSSGVNSTSTIIVVDFLNRFRRNQPSDSMQIRQAKGLSVVVGLIAVGLSLFVNWIGGNLLEVSYKMANLFVAPLFVLFFMALFIPWATPFGTLVGAFGSVGAAIAVAYFGFLGLNFLWIMPAALLVGIFTGALASLAPVDQRKPG